MDSLDQVAEFNMSGRRSVFTLKPGKTIVAAELAAAYEEQGLKFTSLSTEKREAAKLYYVANAGIT